MNKFSRFAMAGAVFAPLALALGGCASSIAPDPAPRQCGPQEHLVCTGKKATKLDTPDDQMEFCRCEYRN